jgi:hypothetical protein
VNPKLADAFPDRPDVTGIAKRQSIDTRRNLGPRTMVAKLRHPARENCRFTNFNDLGLYPIGYDRVKAAA